MSTGRDMLARARRHVGEPCRAALAPKTNANWRGPWEAAEFAAWLVFQEAHILYGCDDKAADPGLASAEISGWARDLSRIGHRVAVEAAVATIGAVLFRKSPFAGRGGHLAISDGNGGTVEARGQAYGVVVHTAHGRHWDDGLLIPHIAYEAASPQVRWKPPASLYGIGWPNMDPSVIEAIQRALAGQGIDPGPFDGVYGPSTAAAVCGFQAMTGLVVDGQVGADTAHALSVGLMVRR